MELELELDLKLGLGIDVFVLVSVEEEEEDNGSVAVVEAESGDLKVTFESVCFRSALSFLLVTNSSNKVSNCCFDSTRK